jgi:hypothetical protein
MNAMEKGITALFYTEFEILKRKEDDKKTKFCGQTRMQWKKV